MRFGEPIAYDGELDQVDDDDDLDELDELDAYDRDRDMGQAFADLVAMGRLGLALARGARSPRPRAEPGVIDMVEVAPGVYARKPTAKARARNPLSRIERLERAFAKLAQEIG